MSNKIESSFKAFFAELHDEWERKMLIDFIRSEINQHEREFKRSGWTPWVLVAAGATLLSYLFSILGSTSPNWNKVGVLYIFISVTLSCVFFILPMSQVRLKKLEEQSRFTFANKEMMDSRPLMLALLLQQIIIFLLYLYLDFKMSQFYCTSLLLFLIPYIIIIAMV